MITPLLRSRRGAPSLLASLLVLAAAFGLCSAVDPGKAGSWKKHGKHLVVPQEGWIVYLHPALLEEMPEETAEMLRLLDVQLDRVEKVVPAKALEHLRTVPIWINPPYDGKGGTAEYHPDAGWLKDNGRDPAMARCVEITNVKGFPQSEVRMPYVMLHELAHAYHHQVLTFEDPEVMKAFRRAVASGQYNEVRRWTGERFTTDKAYAMTNHKEYFAEVTEAFFGKNDFYPFTLDELKKHDPGIVPVLREKWGVED